MSNKEMNPGDQTIFVNWVNSNNLKHMKFSIIIRYILRLFVSNAQIKLVFSLMNKAWNNKKSQLNIQVKLFHK